MQKIRTPALNPFEPLRSCTNCTVEVRLELHSCGIAIICDEFPENKFVVERCLLMSAIPSHAAGVSQATVVALGGLLALELLASRFQGFGSRHFGKITVQQLNNKWGGILVYNYMYLFNAFRFVFNNLLNYLAPNGNAKLLNNTKTHRNPSKSQGPPHQCHPTIRCPSRSQKVPCHLHLIFTVFLENSRCKHDAGCEIYYKYIYIYYIISHLVCMSLPSSCSYHLDPEDLQTIWLLFSAQVLFNIREITRTAAPSRGFTKTSCAPILRFRGKMIDLRPSCLSFVILVVDCYLFFLMCFVIPLPLFVPTWASTCS